MIEAPLSTVEKDLDFGIQDTAFLVLQQEMKGRGRDERRRQNEQKEEGEKESKSREFEVGGISSISRSRSTHLPSYYTDFCCSFRKKDF